MQNNSQRPRPMCPIPQFRLVRGRMSCIFIIPGHPEFRTPLQIPLWGVRGCTLLQGDHSKSSSVPQGDRKPSRWDLSRCVPGRDIWGTQAFLVSRQDLSSPRSPNGFSVLCASGVFAALYTWRTFLRPVPSCPHTNCPFYQGHVFLLFRLPCSQSFLEAYLP